MKRISLYAVILLIVLACRTGNPNRRLNLYPSPTSEALPTQTERVRLITAVPPTPVVVQITTTPKPTKSLDKLCVSATEAVHLRPSPSTENYPIVELKNGTEVVDLGGRNGDWLFVEVGNKRGWINGKYIGQCK